MENTHLYEALKAYCKAALDFLNRDFKRPLIINRETSIFIYRNQKNLKQLKTYQEATKSMKEDTVVAKHLNTLVGTAGSRARVDIDSCLNSLLIMLLKKQKTLHLEEATFDRIYKDRKNILWILSFY